MGLISGVRNTILPAKGASTNATSRVDDYGNNFVLDGLLAPHTQALEGSRFTARAIPAVGGVGVVLGSFPTVFSDTAKIALTLRNGEAAGGKSYVVDYVRARCIAAGANTTSVEAAAEVDTSNRVVSGGTALVVYKANPATAAPASLATVTSGDITCAAASANRQHVGQVLVRKSAAPCLIVEDLFTFSFGAVGSQLVGDVAGPVATTQISANYHLNACAVPPGGTFLFKLALIANSATPAQFDFEIGWVER
jgi:hypothetical protein